MRPMRPYAERKYFAREVRAAFHLANHVIGGLKQRDPEIRCHELAMATALIISKEIGHTKVSTIVWSGKYGAIEHSWLKIHSMVDRPLDWHILDVYAVGRMPQVQLIDGTSLLPESKLYIPGDGPRTDRDQKLTIELFNEMERLVDQVQQDRHPHWAVVLG